MTGEKGVLEVEREVEESHSPCRFPSLTDAFAKALRTFLASFYVVTRPVVIIAHFYLATVTVHRFPRIPL